MITSERDLITIGTLVKKYVYHSDTVAYGIVFANEIMEICGEDPCVRVWWFRTVGPHRLRETPYSQIEFCSMLQKVVDK